MTQRAVPCVVMRGGTSRGAYFSAADLPVDPAERDRVLIAAMGGPDALQVDGIGGGHPLTSKVAVLKPSSRGGVDVDYLFVQVNPTEAVATTAQNCGNILAGVGPYAIEAGWVAVQDDTTTVRVYMENGASLCDLVVQTPNGAPTYDGMTAIDGVPGTAAPIVCEFIDVAGSTCGALLPTGRATDEADGIDVTCIDNGMPVVLLRAVDLGLTGSEAPEALDANEPLKTRLEDIRLQVGERMNLGDVSNKTVPKMTLISPSADAHVGTRTFIPHVCHHSIGVLGAVSVATACMMPGTVARGIASAPPGEVVTFEVGHPTGSLLVQLTMLDGAVERAGVVRTARRIFSGEMWIAT